MSFVTDFIAGTASGVAGMIIEYPFDTVKVLLQAHGSSRYTGYLNCITSIYKQDGFFGFYRGFAARAFASGIDHACIFVFYKWSLRIVGADTSRPTFPQILVGGCGSGVAAAVCLTPFELVKCRMQADDVKGHRRYSSSFDCTKKIFMNEGGIVGLYKGAHATLLREVPGTVAWCGTYDFLKSVMTPPDQNTADLPVLKKMLAGGIAGMNFWTLTFPFDVIKTRIQVDPVFSNYGIVQALKEQYKESGVKGLFRGWTMTALRSFPSNAVIFFVFDSCSEWLTK